MSEPAPPFRFGRRRQSKTTWIVGTTAVVAVVLLIVALIPRGHPSVSVDAASTEQPSATSAPTAAPTSPATTTPTATNAILMLATLPVRPALTITGYNRVGDFGKAWLDVDHNGCDTRDDILARDLTDITRSGACKVLSGVLVSPYTDATIHFVRGEKTSALVQIDHVVALGDAWQTGASGLTQTRREQLANDPLELLAVDGKSNDEKSDKDASQWLPPDASFDCAYVARQIAVKAAYSLWVTPAEHDAMATVLAHC